MSTSSAIASLTQENETLKSALSTTRKLLAAYQRGEVPPADQKTPYYVDQAWLDAAPEFNGPGVGVRQAGAPAGWKLVPIGPTPEMIAAAFAGKIEDQDMMRQMRRRDAMSNDYMIMLAAAPVPPAHAQQQAGALTDEQIMAIWRKADQPCEENDWTAGPIQFARAILAAAKGGA